MQSPPLVSIITPVYNGAAYLDELIVSVRDQDYPFIEHIIIDDGSNDNGATQAILKKYPHLRWWSRENLGQYATMNEGLETASGEIICFVSADDLVLPGAVHSVIELMQRHPEYDGIAGLSQFIDETSAPYPIIFPFQTAPLRYYAYFTQIAHCSLYLKRESLLKKNLFFNPSLRYVGDYDWILQILDQLNLTRTDFHLSAVRIHGVQTSIQQKSAMDEERRLVVTSLRINPFLFKVYTGIYVIAHDLEKLRFASANKGFEGAWQLIVNHYQRSRNQK